MIRDQARILYLLFLYIYGFIKYLKAGKKAITKTSG